MEIYKFSKRNECKIILEPGRSIIGDTAVLISKVIYIKESPTKDFIILDAGMNDLIRPALYNAKHMIIPAIKSSKKSKKEYDFVGPICETGDFIALNRKITEVSNNDKLIIRTTGAYASVMKSNYNARVDALEILIYNGKSYKLKKTDTILDIISKEKIIDFV